MLTAAAVDGAVSPASPPDATVAEPPAVTSLQRLPFGELTWENFERLCYRLAALTDGVEFHSRYGRAGQAQQGIDIYVRLASGRYEVWQVKRYRQFTVPDLRDAVNAFVAGSWTKRTNCLVIAVQADTADTKLQEAAEGHATTLREKGITLRLLGADELASRLKGKPEIVDDFFGRPWALAFDASAAERLRERLDGCEFAKIRAQLAKAYAVLFNLLDPGVLVPDGLQAPSQPRLLDRLVVPDVVIREPPTTRDDPDAARRGAPAPYGNTDTISRRWGSDESERADASPARRMAFDAWVAGSDQIALVGEAGMGKSLLLRCLALDMAGDQTRFAAAGRRWGYRLPVYVSFARWAKAAEIKGGPVSLRDVVAGYLQDLLTADLVGLLGRAIDERRILLLVDGLDEWTEARAASTVLSRLFAFVATHDMPIVASGRPGGLARIGAIPASWRHATLAPLSHGQQAAIAQLWFRHAAGVGGQSDAAASVSALRHSGRFVTALSRDRRLAALGRTPLLLLGLLSLSLRGAALPHGRIEALRQLTQLLLETHPQRRATAAGDTTPRSVHLLDTETRRGALAKLAFEIRLEGSDAGIDVGRAREIVRDYLASGDRSLDVVRARFAADEMLAVNAESVGLLVEKATGEVGFAHASFEEFLAAVHIIEWDLDNILAFVSARAGEPRWRATMMALVGLASRAQEVGLIVEAIEKPVLDVHGKLNRRVLLAGIAFQPAKRPRATVDRLLLDAFREIEAGDWPDSRVAILRFALDAIDDPTVGPAVEERLARWAPRVWGSSSDNLFAALSSWAPAPDLADTLRRAMRSDEHQVRRSAAIALAGVFGGGTDTLAMLVSDLRVTSDLGYVAAILEALYRGWPGRPEVTVALAQAARSVDPTIRLAGICGRIAARCCDDGDKASLVHMVRKGSGLDYWDRPHAERALAAGWPDDSSLVAWSLDSLNRRLDRFDDMEDSAALTYLARCAPAMPGIAEWFTARFGAAGAHVDHPLPFFDFDWASLSPFAEVHPPLREALVRHLCRDNTKFFGHQTHDLIVRLQDDRIRDNLLQAIRATNEVNLIATYWMLSALIRGWGRDDSEVANLLREVAAWPVERLASVTTLLPTIFPDVALCREKLIAVGRVQRIRGGLARTMREIGVSPDDDECVEVLLRHAGGEGSPWDETSETIRQFGSHPRVRQIAAERLASRDPPLAAIAAAYEIVPAMRNVVLRMSTPLPSFLRQQIADADIVISRAMAALRRAFDRECDSSVKTSMAAAYCLDLVAEGADLTDIATQLDVMATATGPDMDERRATAFTGLLILGRLERFAKQTEDAEPLRISLGWNYRRAPRLVTELVDRWEEAASALGTSLVERLGSFSTHPTAIWETLSPYLSPGLPASAAFLDHVGRTDGVLAAESLAALARLLPGSSTLHLQCWRTLQSDGSTLLDELAGMRAAYLLHEEFPRTSADAAAAIDLMSAGRRHSRVVAGCLLHPDAIREKAGRHTPAQNGRIGAWTVALHVGAVILDPEEFADLVCASIKRTTNSVWDMQGVSNAAITRRLSADDEAAEALVQRNRDTRVPSERASLPRLLAAAGRADEEMIALCRARLVNPVEGSFVIAGYDCVADQVRPVTHALLNVVSSPHGL